MNEFWTIMLTITGWMLFVLGMIGLYLRPTRPEPRKDGDALTDTDTDANDADA